MEKILDLDRWPIDDLTSERGREMIARCKAELARIGMFNLPGFMRPEALETAVAGLAPKLENESFVHASRHNIYFKKSLPDVAAGHPVLIEFDTSNNTICADQFIGNLVLQLYEWPPFAAFLATVMEMPVLHTMPDPLARVNVMSYGPGQALNWHFDRSEFTTTLLLQAPDIGGDFQYCKDLRSDDDPNYNGVARMLAGESDNLVTLPVQPGTLNVFRGKNTAHRVTPVAGDKKRIIAVFSYYERPNMMFTDEERIGFFGRVG